MPLLFAIMAVLLLWAQPVSAFTTREVTAAGKTVVQWLPDDFMTSGKTYPLVIFSHGYGGCARQSKYLTGALADAGYVVAAPTHADGSCGLTDREPPQERFRQPEKWTGETYIDRHDDLVAVLQQALNDPATAARINRDQLALAGHSLGGYTVLGMAGGWSGWRDRRFKAVLALSPFADPFIVHKTLPSLVMPVMYQGGTKDWGVTPTLKKSGGGGYDLSPAPKYFMNIDGGRHMSFSDRGQNAAEYKLITSYAIAFFDRHVRGLPAPLLDQAKPMAGVAEFRAQTQ